jgi:hypothetical protein
MKVCVYVYEYSENVSNYIFLSYTKQVIPNKDNSKSSRSSLLASFQKKKVYIGNNVRVHRMQVGYDEKT